jgi:hypothetical protein
MIEAFKIACNENLIIIVIIPTLIALFALIFGKQEFRKAFKGLIQTIVDLIWSNN